MTTPAAAHSISSIAGDRERHNDLLGLNVNDNSTRNPAHLTGPPELLKSGSQTQLSYMSRARWRTCSATPVWAWDPPASKRRPCSTCSMATTPSACVSPWSRRSPCCSRPDPSGESLFVSASGPSGAPTSPRGIGTCDSRPWTSSASASTPRKPEPRPRGPGFWLGDATMSAGYPSEPKFAIDSISAALRSRGCSPRATFSLSTK